MSADLYDTDFYAWAMRQAALLRAGELSAADLDHIAEEIESMGRSEKRELVSRLELLLLHLLKWQHQPERRSVSWELSIANNRDAVVSHLDDNPSLKSRLDDAIAEAFRRARRGAAAETNLPLAVFPDPCPWSFDQMVDDGFWPGGR